MLIPPKIPIDHASAEDSAMQLAPHEDTMFYMIININSQMPKVSRQDIGPVGFVLFVGLEVSVPIFCIKKSSCHFGVKACGRKPGV